MKHSVMIMLSTALLLGLGCGSKGNKARSSESSGGDAVPNTRVTKSGGDEVTAEIGPPGGVLELSSGVRVEIPAGAVQGSESFVLKKAPGTTAFLNEERERPVGPTFVLSPAVTAREGSVVTVSYKLPSLPEGWGEPALGYEYAVGERVRAEDSIHTRWQYEDAPESGGRATARVPGLNGMRLQFVLTNTNVQ